MVESRFTALTHRVRIGQFVSVGAVGAMIETVIVALLTTIGGGGRTARCKGSWCGVLYLDDVHDQRLLDIR